MYPRFVIPLRSSLIPNRTAACNSAAMKRIAFTCLLFPLSLVAMASGTFPPSLKDACDSLDYYIANREKYLMPHEAIIDSLSALVPAARTPADSLGLYKALGDNYRAINLDSSIMCYGRVIEIGNRIPDADAKLAGLLLKVRLRRDALLPIRGITHEAILDFERINPDSILLPEDRKTYFQGAVDVFSNIAGLYPEGKIRDAYVARAVVYVDSLLSYHRPGGLGSRMTGAHRWKLTGEGSEAIAELMDTMSYFAGEPALLATAASLVARYYATQPAKEDEYLYYQTLSVINDIKSGHREVTSLQRLGKEWYRRGDVDRAYRYLSLALGEAVASGASARVLESSRDLPLITQSFQEHDRRHTRVLASLVLILIGALIIILVMTAFLRRDHRKSEKLRVHLAELNRSKDFYIQNVLMLCSVFFERLDEFNRYVGRKIKANQIKDLYDSIESRKYLATQSEEISKSFDATFRTIHPNFVRQLNSILREDRRLPEPAKGESMTPEMRIAAFMRLGIDDSAILAKFLGLGLNTIYTYRNRLKNRAINRDTFEEDIRKVGL